MEYEFRWDPAKSLWLELERGISFEEIVKLIVLGHLRDLVQNPVQSRLNQALIVIERKGEFWGIPAVREGENRFFLKTAYPSRKLKKIYGKKIGKL